MISQIRGHDSKQSHIIIISLRVYVIHRARFKDTMCRWFRMVKQDQGKHTLCRCGASVICSIYNPRSTIMPSLFHVHNINQTGWWHHRRRWAHPAIPKGYISANIRDEKARVGFHHRFDFFRNLQWNYSGPQLPKTDAKMHTTHSFILFKFKETGLSNTCGRKHKVVMVTAHNHLRICYGASRWPTASPLRRNRLTKSFMTKIAESTSPTWTTCRYRIHLGTHKYTHKSTHTRIRVLQIAGMQQAQKVLAHAQSKRSVCKTSLNDQVGGFGGGSHWFGEVSSQWLLVLDDIMYARPLTHSCIHWCAPLTHSLTHSLTHFVSRLAVTVFFLWRCMASMPR